jgi:putative copper export protein
MNDAYYTVILLFDLTAFAAAVGALSCLVWVVPWGALPETAVTEAAWRRLRFLLAMAMVVLTLTSLLMLIVQAAQMSRLGLTAVWPILPTVLLRTHYGAVWLIRVAALAVVWIGWLLTAPAGRVRTMSVMSVAAAGVAWTYSATSHAADKGDFTWAEWTHWLHVLSGSLWGGCLLAVAFSLSGLLVPRTASHKAFIAESMHRLSYIAMFAVIAISVTGVVSAVFQLTQVQDLWETDYGRMLVIKASVVLAMLLFGVFNHFAMSPALRSWFSGFRTHRQTEAPTHPPSRRQGSMGKMMLWHRRIMNVQAVLVVVVLLCAILLAATMPPRQHAAMKHPQAGSHVMH